MANVAQRRGWLLGVASTGLVAWAAVGFYQGLNSGFSGGLYDTEYVVPGAWPGSLAEKSGFRAGDRVISVEGTPVEELGMESRWPRRLAPRIGQSLERSELHKKLISSLTRGGIIILELFSKNHGKRFGGTSGYINAEFSRRNTK